MKTARDCKYITPCGWCSRKNENCKELEKEKQKIKEKRIELSDKAPWEEKE